jgi:dTDP-6-deoxy-L-talose 4-dehydrogenase (NAD+)
VAKTILVTGANGYIGQKVVEQLLDLGHNVLAADLVIDGIDPQADRLQVNLFKNPGEITKRIDRIDACLHLAWRNGFNHFANSHIDDLPGHFGFISSLLEAGLKHIAVQGTMHEIGYWEGIIDENTPTNPISYYGIAKNALRQATALMAMKNNVTFQWLRAYYILGDDKRNHSIFTKILEAEERGDATFPVTTGKNAFDFIEVDQLAYQIALAITQSEVTGIINTCTGKATTLREKVEEFISTRHLNIRPQFGVFPDRPYDSPIVYGDNTKIQRIIAAAGQE